MTKKSPWAQGEAAATEEGQRLTDRAHSLMCFMRQEGWDDVECLSTLVSVLCLYSQASNISPLTIAKMMTDFIKSITTHKET